MIVPLQRMAGALKTSMTCPSAISPRASGESSIAELSGSRNVNSCTIGNWNFSGEDKLEWKWYACRIGLSKALVCINDWLDRRLLGSPMLFDLNAFGRHLPHYRR
jgi:hypothetical protein